MNTHLGQGCYLHQGVIPATAAGPGALKGFSIAIPRNNFRRRLYAAVVVDDVRTVDLVGEFAFQLGGTPVAKIPVRLLYYATGWGQVNAVNYSDQVGCLPAFSVTRTENDSAGGNFALPVGDAPLGLDLMQKAWLYQDDAGTGWVYRLTMSPMRFEMEADSLVWTPFNFSGTAGLAATTMHAAVVAAVLSDQ